MYTWPTSVLGDVSVTPCAQGSLAAVARTAMDSGRIRQRQRFTTDIRHFDVQWWFTDQKYAIFQAVVKLRLNMGNDYFTIDLPLGDQVGVMGGTPTPLTSVSARFVGGANGIKAAWQPSLWQVSAQLEVETVPGLTAGNLTTLGA